MSGLEDRNNRILVIDDNELIHADFAKILGARGDGGELEALDRAIFGESPGAPNPRSYELDAAYQGQEGLDMVRNALADGNPYGVAFVDMRMPPGWDGVETIERLWEVDPDLQVVMCTAYSDYTWSEMIERLGRTDRLLILKKPFDHIEVWQLACALTEKWSLTRRARLKMTELEELVGLRTTELQAANERLESEITERRQAEEQLRYHAYHDPLTGLPNRALLMDQLARCLERTHRDADYVFAVLFLDFDNFKVINDSLGHDVGDELLIQIAQRLTASLRSIDSVGRLLDETAARLGGDEFVVILDGIRHSTDAAVVAERLQKHLAPAYKVDGNDITISASIGIALNERGYDNGDQMLRDADTAMYRAKEAGKARYSIFDQEMHVQAMERLQRENDLRRAIERDELRIEYQPIVSLRTGRITGVEALARWDRNGETEWPAQFIGVAEETGLIAQIGAWILNEACREISLLNADRPVEDRLHVNINLSKRQLMEPTLIESIASHAEQYGLRRSELHIEITEAAMIETADLAASQLGRLKSLGVMLEMDDFGTGYSSLSLLHRFPIDVLKIDREFMQNLGNSEGFAAVAHAIITLAQKLHMSVTVEGVETKEELDAVVALGCDLAQGRFMSPPVSGEELARLLGSNPAWPIAGDDRDQVRKSA